MTTEMVLKKYAIPRGALDRESVKDALLADLREQKRWNNRLYIVFFSAICVVYLIAVSGAVTDLIKNQTARVTILAAAGIGIPFVLNYMRKVVSEWSKTNLLITLVGHSDEASSQMLIEKLIASEAVGLGTSPPVPAGR